MLDFKVIDTYQRIEGDGFIAEEGDFLITKVQLGISEMILFGTSRSALKGK